MLRSARTRPSPLASRPARQGTVLIIVLVVVVLLALGAYTFSEFMVLEARSAHMHGQAVRARALADSGVEMVAAQLQEGLAADPLAIYDNPDLYRGASLQQGDGTEGQFSIVAPITGDDTGLGVRYGLMDESGKLNVNTILTLKGLRDDEEKARLILSYLPYSSQELVDSILDFIDEDNEPREFGAESEVYESYGYSAKNAPLDTLDELLLVQGVTPELLFGEDANRNGLLDPSENDGDATAPFDNSDGRLDRGWSAYLTVHGRERNLQIDGADRIYANNGVLTDLYDELVEAFDEDVATFVVAYRMNGKYDPENPDGTTPANPGSGAQALTEQMNRNMQNGQTEQQAQQAAALSIGKAIAGSAGTPGTITRGGMDLSKGATTTLNSLYDLVGVEVKATVNGTETILPSPWQNDASMPEYLPELMDKLTLFESPAIEARVNVNQASFEALAGVLTAAGLEGAEDLAGLIVDAQKSATGGSSISDTLSTRATTGWLITEGLVDLEIMRQIDPFLTARGDVYRLQSVGFFPNGGPTARVEAVIDASGETPQIIFLRDLTDLGRGYPASLLGN